jgi:hypothetical protein
MKKYVKFLVLILVIFLFSGCTNIKDLTVDDIVGTVSNKDKTTINTYRKGYSYHLPRNMMVQSYTLYNDVIQSGNVKYYLYVDMVSHFNKVKSTYKETDGAYYSKVINNKEIEGYLEINLVKDNKYLIEIMYNYAKIEVMVNRENINESLIYSLSILKSIVYNDSVIENMLKEDVLTYTEEDFNIFNTTSKDSNYLNYDNEYQEVDNSEEKYDSDLLN